MNRAGVLLATVALATIVAGVAATTAGADDDELREVRSATARFHNVKQAERAGYTPFADCFDSSEGGMGQHYVSDALLNDGGVVDATEPEALVYEVRGGKLKLVAVEYIVLQADVEGPPRLFGHDFHEFGPFYVLHAWSWRDNSAGIFADWNPDVAPCS